MSPARSLADRLWTGLGFACVIATLLLSSSGLRVTPLEADGAPPAMHSTAD
ncbi:MAG TPA: hypothetical protein PLW10_00365 [Myxococcota bacterium]|nr:hypothetical protein [Myxococcales bacterium]HPG24059.1 hypothetical protein [Myxococcota bacterium]